MTGDMSGTPDGTATTPVIPDTSVGTGANVAQFGRVDISNDDDEVNLSASFISLPSAIAFPTFAESFRPPLDVCDVTVIDLSDIFTNPTIPTTIPDTIGGSGATLISAGDVLTISSPAGSYAELKKSEMLGFVLYEADEAAPLAAPSPNGLTISIPGDVFPAFLNVAIPDVEPLIVSNPTSGGPITPNTTFSWTPSANADSFVEISASVTAASLAQITSVDCTVADDGSFEFPAAIKAELGGGFSGFGSLERQALNIVQTGNAALLLSSGSE